MNICKPPLAVCKSVNWSKIAQCASTCPCVQVRWWVMQRDADAWCHTMALFKTCTHTHIYTPPAQTFLCIFIRCTVSPSMPLSLFLSLTFALSFHRFLQPASPLHTHVLPLLLQMGWVESWLRTFTPKTTCHPSLLLSRTVMLWEVGNINYGRWCKLNNILSFLSLPHFVAHPSDILSVFSTLDLSLSLSKMYISVNAAKIILLFMIYSPCCVQMTHLT